MKPLGYRQDKPNLDGHAKATRGRVANEVRREVATELDQGDEDAFNVFHGLWVDGNGQMMCACGDRAHDDDRECILDQCYPECDCSRCRRKDWHECDCACCCGAAEVAPETQGEP